MNFKKIASVSEIPQGQGKIVELDGNSIAVGTWWELPRVSECVPHRGGPVGEGEIEGNVITCPWHGWSFDVTTGFSPVNPNAKLTATKCRWMARHQVAL